MGPFLSAETLDEFSALANAAPAALGRWGPDGSVFDDGYRRFRVAHHEMSRDDRGAHARLLRLGTRLWREGRRDRDDEEANTGLTTGTAWTPELVQGSLERLALRAAHARRRAIWLTRLVDAAVAWTEPGTTAARLIVIANGEIVLRTDFDGDAPPSPPGHTRAVAARRDVFTVACFDRLRVLTSELKRLVAANAPAAVRFGVAPPLANGRLAAALWWV